MPHQVHLRTLGRTSDHRLSMLRSLAVSVLRYERVRTTEPKAKEVRRLVEKIVGLGLDATLVARRRALALTRDPLIVEKVFTDLRQRFADRHSGFVRVVRLGHRVGDGAPLALIELLEGAPAQAKPAEAPEPLAESGVRGIARRLRGRRAEEKPDEKPEDKPEKKAETRKAEKPTAKKAAAKTQRGAKRASPAKPAPGKRAPRSEQEDRGSPKRDSKQKREKA